MTIKTVITGELYENCYILENNNDVLIVDPGDDFEKIKDEIGKKNVLGVLVTHAHHDHIGALDKLVKECNPKIYYSNKNKELNYNNMIEINESNYKIGDFEFKTVYFPGHRNDLYAFYFEKENIMFTGDFLFFMTIGRTDMEYGNREDMIKSINKIKTFNKNLIIYPGHGRSTVLENELLFNEYMK